MSATSTTDARQTIQLSVDDGAFCLRGLSPLRHRFELEYALERGSTANSFIFEADGNHPAALIHPPGAAYGDGFLPALDDVLPNADEPILVVVGHVNPNRVALLRNLAETRPQLELIASNAGAKLLRELWSQRKPPAPGQDADPPPLPQLPHQAPSPRHGAAAAPPRRQSSVGLP